MKFDIEKLSAQAELNIDEKNIEQINRNFESWQRIVQCILDAKLRDCNNIDNKSHVSVNDRKNSVEARDLKYLRNDEMLAEYDMANIDEISVPRVLGE